MTRLLNSVLLLLACATAARAGWVGFPLAANTNAATWYAIQQAGIDPVGQVFNAIDERYRAVYGHDYFSRVTYPYTGLEYATPYGGMSSNVYEVYRPILVQTVTEVAGVTTSVVSIADGLYWTEGWWNGYEEPDSEGRYYVYWNDAYQWIRPQYVTNYGSQVFIPGITFTNTALAYTNITHTNTFSGLPVTRATLATLWDYIGAIATEFINTGTNTVPEYLAGEPMYYAIDSVGGSYTNTFYDPSLYLPGIGLGSVFEKELAGFGWVTWEPLAGYSQYGVRATAHWVEGGFNQPSTHTTLARATQGTNGTWATVFANEEPSYVPEWFWLGDTNAPLARWEYGGTNTPPTSVTVSGTVWRANYLTNATAVWPASPPGGWPPMTLKTYYDNNGEAGLVLGSEFPKYNGRSAVAGVVETVAAGAASTNVWRDLTITTITGGAVEPYAALSVVWDLHHLAPYRLYAEEFDRMYKALNAMRVTSPACQAHASDPGWYWAVTRYYVQETNGTWASPVVATNNTAGVRVDGYSAQLEDETFGGYYRTATVQVGPWDNPHLSTTNVTATATLAGGFYAIQSFWYNWPALAWVHAPGGFNTRYNPAEAFDTRQAWPPVSAYEVPVSGGEPATGEDYGLVYDAWWYFLEWNFDYH